MNLLAYTTLYHNYKQPLARFFRIIFVLIMSSIIVYGFSQHTFLKGPCAVLSFFFMVEIFYRFKVLKVVPTLTIEKNDGKDVYTSFTLQALDCFFFAQSTKRLAKNLVASSTVRFIMHKINLELHDLPILDIEKQQIAQKAMDLAKEMDGKFITRMDLFVAYMLLIEPQTHLLFQKHLKEEEILHILYWARSDFPEEEIPPKKRITLWGEGVFDSITTGWSLETRKYTTDITYKVLDEKPTLVGRKKEFQELVEILSRPSRNNALLVGETGAGKTSLVEAIALDSFFGVLPAIVSHKRMYQLNVGLLIAGVKDMGDLEARLETILQELMHAGNVILYVPDLENILGSQTFHMDLTGALIPYLRGNKHIPFVATITAGAYKNYVEPISAFADLFEIVRIDELSHEDATQMLLEKASEIGDKNGVSITYKAVISAVDMADRFMQDNVLPGSAVSLLESVAASVCSEKKWTVDENDIIAKMEQKTHIAIATPGESEKEVLLHMEEKLHERIVDQEEAVSAISEAIRRLRSGLNTSTRPISFLFLGPTGVGKTETAKALASVYFGGEDKTIRLDMSEYTSANSIDRLLGAAPGQGKEKGELTDKVHDNPFSLILLDEFEKAHPEILDLFLQVLEDGRLTDNHGKTVSFATTIIIATSNAGALFILDELQKGTQIDRIFTQRLLTEVEKEHLFKPELLNRFDDIVVFKPLSEKDMKAIARLYLQEVQNTLKKQDILATFDESIIALVAKEGFDQEFGARPLRRFIQDKIEDAIAREKLEGKIDRGSHIAILADRDGNILFTNPPIEANA